MRDFEAEKKHPAVKFDFEDVEVDLTTIYELIVDEIIFYNPNTYPNLNLTLPKFTDTTGQFPTIAEKYESGGAQVDTPLGEDKE